MSQPTTVSISSPISKDQHTSEDSQETTVLGPGEANKYFNLYNAQIVDYLETNQGPVARAVEGREPGQLVGLSDIQHSRLKSDARYRL